MSKIAEATARPWRAVALGSEGARIYPDCEDKRESMKHLAIVDGRDTVTAIANARLIVQAVNSFEAMRDALKACISSLPMIPVDWSVNWAKEEAEKASKALDMAREALKLAGAHNAD